MKTIKSKVATNNLNKDPESKRNHWNVLFLMFFLSVFFSSANVTFGHCDTMDGPVIKDARKAIETVNVNYALKWVRPQSEAEVKDAFTLTLKVRKLSSDARFLADKYFFETVVRLHRSGEGMPFTGVKPSGTSIDEKILAADKSIESGNLSPLKGLVPKERLPELELRYKKVVLLKNFDVNNVEAGREYIEAYVRFFKYAEGEDENHNYKHKEVPSN